MNFLYRIDHVRSSLSVLGITGTDPTITYGFNNSSKAWTKLMHRYRLSKNDLQTALRISILQQSDDIHVLKQWLKHYYKMWDVFNNPSFIYSNKRYLYYKKTIRKRSKHPRKRSTVSSTLGHFWYTDGFKNILLPPNQSPPIGFKRGQSFKKRTKPGPSINNHPCISPIGELFPSLKKAAEHYDCLSIDILRHIKRGVSGWHYAEDKKYKPRADKRFGNKCGAGNTGYPKAVRDPMGNVHYSIREAARQYSVTDATIKKWIKRKDGWEFV
jgi:hypothetical protein